jgi:hypothetical protein
LKGLNFLKNKSDPIAMEDSEYPPWLWTILQKQDKKAAEGAAGDLFCMSLPSPPYIITSHPWSSLASLIRHPCYSNENTHSNIYFQRNPKNSADWPLSVSAPNNSRTPPSSSPKSPSTSKQSIYQPETARLKAL